MSDHRPSPPENTPTSPGKTSEKVDSSNPLVLIDECLATLPEDAPQHKLLYKIQHHLLQEGVSQQQREAEIKKLNEVVGKLTAPANRIGTLLDLPEEGIARISVGGSEFYTNVDPRLQKGNLKIGEQVLVNEAYVLIDQLGYDQNGSIVKIKDSLPDGRLRIESDSGRQGVILNRGSALLSIDLKSGDEVRVDPTQRLALERIEKTDDSKHVLDETPEVTWEQIGGQTEAINSIRKAIEYPLLHANTYTQYKFSQPKGFLLHGPPGCGKTLIGQATANSLAQLAAEHIDSSPNNKTDIASPSSLPPISGGAFLHVKGPEVLNMWVGESERIIRDLFTQARERRKSGLLPFIFIDEAESILGTRRAMRSYNISNTLVPMFCTELDGIESLQDVVVILASNRPDLIDPAVLRPGRIDRKIKVNRPGKDEAAQILRLYLTPDLPFEEQLLQTHHGNREEACEAIIQETVNALFSRTDENRILSVHLRNGKRETLYRSDLVSGAILASIVQRAKEHAIERTIQDPRAGLTGEDLSRSVQNEFQEGEILPPDDSAEEWLKLLDHHPDQIVGVSSFRRDRKRDNLPIRNII
jgi:proteasome-associated ATPase